MISTIPCRTTKILKSEHFEWEVFTDHVVLGGYLGALLLALDGKS